MDTAGFSTQRCDGIYIRRMETCARSMQQIFRFSALILKQQQQQLFHDFQKLLGYCQPWRKHSLLSKIEIDRWQSWCAEIRIWPQNWRSLRSNNKVLAFIMHRKPHFFGLVCHRRFDPRWHFRLFLIWILKYLIFRPHEMFNVFVCRTASYWNI